MDAGTAHNGSVDIAYERFGADGDDPLLLVMGLGMQMISWPQRASRAILARPRDAAPYLLDDMASDGVAALDALGWPSAHLVGVSLGGMIAQTIANRHDEAWLRDTGRRAFERGQDPLGARRQLAAILASGDRRAGLAGVRVPTLVLHGDADPLVRPSGGRATAAAVPGARLVVYPGLGHDLPAALWRPFIDQIGATARTAVR